MNGCVILAGKIAESEMAVTDVDSPYGRVIDATKETFKALHLKFKGAVLEEDYAHVKGEYPDGRTVRVNIANIRGTALSVKVRVGTSTADKAAAENILETIRHYLSR